MAKGFVVPSNEVLITGRPLVIELKLETATGVHPGMLVTRDSSGTNIEVCDATEKPIGWVGYGQAHPNYLPTNIDTDYAVNSFVPILFGGNFVISGIVASTGDVDIGDYVIPAADGEVSEAAAISGTIASGDTTVLSTAADGALVTGVGSAPVGGIIVGIAVGEQTAGRCAISSLI